VKHKWIFSLKMNETFYGPTAPTLSSSTNASNYDITAENDFGPGVDIKERTVSYTYEQITS
jgi:hypothetical protein